jgi:hypothetical protein
MLKVEYNDVLIAKDANNRYLLNIPVIPRHFVVSVPVFGHFLWLSSPILRRFRHRPWLEVEVKA